MRTSSPSFGGLGFPLNGEDNFEVPGEGGVGRSNEATLYSLRLRFAAGMRHWTDAPQQAEAFGPARCCHTK